MVTLIITEIDSHFMNMLSATYHILFLNLQNILQFNISGERWKHNLKDKYIVFYFSIKKAELKK